MERLLSVLAKRRLHLDLGLNISVTSCLNAAQAHRVHLDLRQSRLAGSSHDLHDLDELVGIVSTSEQRVTSDHFGEAMVSDSPSVQRACNSHATHTPYVDACAVRPRAQKHVGCSVPKRDHLGISLARTRPAELTSLLNVLTGTPNALARPKSPILSSPLRLISRFCGLRSR